MRRYIVAISLLCLMVQPAWAADRRWERSLTPVPKESQQPKPAVNTEEPVSVLDVEKVKKLLEVLKESPTPLRTPDVMLKVLFLPYTDSKGVLHNYKDTFLKVEEGKWVLGDYLKAPGAKNRRMMLRPLDSPLPPKAEGKEMKDDKQPRETSSVSQSGLQGQD